MIRPLNVDDKSCVPAELKPTPEMLARRRAFLAETAGAWDDEDGQGVAKWIEETFERLEPLVPSDG